jgi:hypothetical protein
MLFYLKFYDLIIRSAFLSTLLLFSLLGQCQMITGIWKGKINRQKTEVKIIQNGDSLTGTSYYYESANNYRRYSIKGFFDANTNEAVWWDDQLLEEKSGRTGLFAPGKVPLLSRADFNCPGDGSMMLDGKAAKTTNEEKPVGEVELDKTGSSSFPDEWDFVIENYTTGANDPTIIDSISAIAQQPLPIEQSPARTETIATPAPPPIVQVKPAPQKETPKPVSPPSVVKEEKPIVVIAAPTIEQKFTTRKKVLVTEIPVMGDSVELRFYDNAEIDGDSITLFLNDKLIFQHIRLTGSAYTIKLAVADLGDNNELTMVAENLGSIPPNTSYMVAIVNEQRYEARLESTEGSSAMVRFVKKKPLRP